MTEPATAAATEAPVEDAPAETVSDPAGDLRPVPTVVIGQDGNGDDIVIQFEVATGCATTFHQPLDDNSPSFIRWEFDAPSLAPGTTVEVKGDGAFLHFTMVTDAQKVIVEQGISSYGSYGFPSVGWTVDESNSSAITLGGSHTVDDTEGETSQTCIDPNEPAA